ncbi:hypothetical protein [Streptomyces sp. NPDC003480]
MTDRRPLGTGPVHARASGQEIPELPPAPCAQLAAERLPTSPAATSLSPAQPTGRRTLGTGPAMVGGLGVSSATPP